MSNDLAASKSVSENGKDMREEHNKTAERRGREYFVKTEN